MSLHIRLSVLIVLFFGINQRWAQRLDARREWLLDAARPAGNFESMVHLVYHNDSLFALSYSPIQNPNPLLPTRIVKFGHQVYATNLDSLKETRVSDTLGIIGTDLIGSAIKVPHLNIRGSKLGLVTLISKSKRRSVTND